MAQHWVGQGAARLHLVDLDGARQGHPVNLAAIEAILAAVGAPCQLGGGIRDQETIGRLLEIGLARLVIGTLAICQPDWFGRMCRAYPGKLALAIDARAGRVATHGWLRTSEVEAVDLARRMAEEPLAAINYTDIETDGMLSGPNLSAIARVKEAVAVPVVASGGVRTAEDVARLAAAGVDGCIIGRALYEGTLTLPEALAAAGEI